ncbi:MAG: hypothetical protein ACRDDY_03785 [Clostridium sp.]|uniref:hypothetical protein n=1 Tax=Clostridium sp. TaxID=1506 RepID=UPI003EE6970F
MKNLVINKRFDDGKMYSLKKFSVDGEGVKCTWNEDKNESLVFTEDRVAKVILELINVENANIFVRENINTQGESNEKI